MHTNKIPLYEKIYHDLREKIQTNYYKAGEIIPTEQELMTFIMYQESRSEKQPIGLSRRIC